MTQKAISRRLDVVSRVEGDETLVLDLQTQTAHCLSGDVAGVWNAEVSSLAEIAAVTGLSTASVDAAIASLRELGLLAESAGVSRRMLVRGAAVGGAVVAAGVVSIPLPASANAASAGFTLTRLGNCNANSTATLVFSVSSGHLAGSSTYSFPAAYYTKADQSQNSNTVTITLTTDPSGNISGAAGVGAVGSFSFTSTSVSYTTTSKFFGLMNTTPTITRSVPTTPPDSRSFTANATPCP